MEIGQLIKKIRKAKRIRQVDLVGDELTRTTLSKIENGNINPSTRNFFFLIGRLGVSFDEFFFLLNDRAISEKQQLLVEFNQLKNNADLAKIQALKARMEHYLSAQASLEIEIVVEILEAQIQLNKETNTFHISPLTKENASKVWKRLVAYDEWYLNELTFVNSILFYFSTDMAVAIAHRLIRELERYSDYHRSEELIAFIYFNVSTIMLMAGNKKRGLEYLQLCEEKAWGLKRADIYASTLYRKGYLTKDRQLQEKAVMILETFDDQEVLAKLLQESEQFEQTKR